MFGRKTVNKTQGSHGNIQAGGNVGISEEKFIEEMRRKDQRIDDLIAEKDALKDKVSALEKEKLEAEIAELQGQKQGLEERLVNPAEAFRNHKARATLVETLLDDIANQQAFGENRIRSALEAFANLEYDEIDGLLDESENRGVMLQANSAFARGVVAEDAVKWHDAYDHYKRAANLSEDLAHLKAYAHMAWRLRKGDEAVLINRQLADRAKSEFGPESAKYATQLNNLASVVRDQGRFEEAEALFREALEIGKATIGERHPSYATRLNNLASVVRAQGRFEEAEALFREALEIDRATIGERHPDFATDLNSLGIVVRDQGRLGEAEGLFREALKIDKATIGERHPDYANDLNNLAGVVQAQGRFDEAERLYRAALEILNDTLGADHPDTLQVQKNLDALLAKKPDTPPS